MEHILPILTPMQQGLLEQYAVLLKVENARLGLVSRAKVDRLFAELLEPCLAFAALSVFQAEMLRVVDLGSGGGLPGVPLAIIRPTMNLLLVESQLKKCQFLDRVVNELDLCKVYVLHARIERLRDLPAPDIFTARFLKDPRMVAAWTRRWRCKGTRYLLFAGDNEISPPILYDLHLTARHPLTAGKVALEYVCQ